MNKPLAPIDPGARENRESEDRPPGYLPVPASMRPEARRLYADFLPDSQAVAERAHSPLARTLLLVLSLMVIAFVAYISIAEVDQVASAQGVVRPGGRVKVVNHPDGGRVAAIHVREGDQVVEGQPLLELDPAIIGEEVEKRRAAWIVSELQVARLTAEAAGLTPEFPDDLADERPDLVASERALYQARAEAIATRRAQADEVVRQRQQDVATLEARDKQQRQSLELLRQQIAALEKLRAQGYFPELRYLTVLRELSDAEGQLAETQTQLEAARAALAEAESKRVSVDREWRAQVQQELADAIALRDEVLSLLNQSDTALAGLVVLSPADGIVQELKVNNLGQSVGANQELMKIVPLGDQLIVEAKVANADISHVEVGQQARVKITTYNYIRFGVLEGKVTQISPDATKDERSGVLYFSVYVETEKNYLGDQPGQYPVSPGMTAEVDLVIGKRTILAFLTDRLRQTAAEAFGE
ncbi:MAG TPA: HlyD family type I secretion periplasmic adaptor subunit [Kiloniellales bacterium]|nr:HlyD family type I secretion periplasmic adaptor subunit [Kiloniellales bacterium]